MRRALAALAALTLSLSLASPTGAAEPEGAPKEVTGAQKRANEAASKLAQAQSSLARAEEEVAALKVRISATRARLAQLRAQVRDLAVRQYVQGGDPAVWILQSDVGEASRGRALLRHVTMGRTDAIDEYRAANADLEDGQEALERRLGQQRKAVGDLRADQIRMTEELEELAQAQRAYEAKVAEQQAAAERAAAEKDRADGDPADGAGRAAAPVQAGPVRVRPPRPPTTPGGGPQVIGSGEWVCPVQGTRSFTNDYGQLRSGGRRHQGTDIMAPRGTPVVANVAGSVRGHNSGLGGISYYLRGVDGHTYFGTHLDRLSGTSGNVAAGTVIGYVGNSGNARGGPMHLHFEIHPNGGGPVNPYPTLRRYC